MNYEKEFDNVLDELIERGYYAQSTHEEEIRELLATEKIPFYIGFDATADSLTIGHFIQIMVMMRMQAYGHIPVALLGGGTTLIGDPSDRNDMRSIMTKEVIDQNAENFRKQISRFIDFSDEKAHIANNADWLLDLNFLDFMRTVGIHFNVSQMLQLDSYQNRLKDGLTFFEFSYMLMQSYDFTVLHEKYNVKLQMGGSDQWSNIIGGIDLTRKMDQEQVYGMTFQLLTTADGEKMGKSQKGAIWLDEEKTSPYELFQYMRNVDDRDVEKFLLMLTFLPIERCKQLGSLEGQEINKGKEVLAYEVTKLIHGKEKADKALETSHSLFDSLTSGEDMPSTEFSKDEILDMGVLNLLTSIGLSQSNGEARRMIQQNGYELNGEKITDPRYTIQESDYESGEIIFKRGRRTFHRVIVND